MPKRVTPSIPANTAMPSDRRISAPAPVATTRGTTPRMNANQVIRIGRKRSFTASSVASQRRNARLLLLLGKFDNQDRILAGQADQHHEADLREDRDLDPGQRDADHRAKQTHRHDKNRGQRQRPTGGWPTRPPGALMFWLRMALVTSMAVAPVR